MAMPLHIAYYVSSHGLGHAGRVLEVVGSILELDPSARCTLVTAAPIHLLLGDAPLHPRLSLRPAWPDGCVQVGAFNVDGAATLAAYASLDRPALIAGEVAWMRAAGVHLVVSDIVPLAFPSAAAAGLQSVCVSNFSWVRARTPPLSPIPTLFPSLASATETAAKMVAHTHSSRSHSPPLSQITHNRTSFTPPSWTHAPPRRSGGWCCRSPATLPPRRCCCACPAPRRCRPSARWRMCH